MSSQLSVTESNLNLVEQFNEAVFVDHEFDRIEEFVAEDIAHVEGGETVFEGVDALREYFEEMLASYEDIEMDVVSMVANDETVIYHFWLTGTISEDVEMGGQTMEAAGTELSWEGFVRMTIENGRIAEANLLTDEASVLRQLGVLPAQSA